MNLFWLIGIVFVIFILNFLFFVLLDFISPDQTGDTVSNIFIAGSLACILFVLIMIYDKL
tara:strand:+ start:105 stop:284 length:180 start_codon:yes stop_codon:yes gene_type:complete